MYSNSSRRGWDRRQLALALFPTRRVAPMTIVLPPTLLVRPVGPPVTFSSGQQLVQRSFGPLYPAFELLRRVAVIILPSPRPLPLQRWHGIPPTRIRAVRDLRGVALTGIRGSHGGRSSRQRRRQQLGRRPSNAENTRYGTVCNSGTTPLHVSGGSWRANRLPSHLAQVSCKGFWAR